MGAIQLTSTIQARMLARQRLIRADQQPLGRTGPTDDFNFFRRLAYSQFATNGQKTVSRCGWTRQAAAGPAGRPSVMWAQPASQAPGPALRGRPTWGPLHKLTTAQARLMERPQL